MLLLDLWLCGVFPLLGRHSSTLVVTARLINLHVKLSHYDKRQSRNFKLPELDISQGIPSTNPRF
jgi:hypothetical protein